MSDIPTSVLFGALFFLLFLSGFFSGSETGLISLNRYRLKHLVKARHPGAVRASRLLDQPERLIGLILLGNNFVNILASAIATILGLRLAGEAGIAIATGILTFTILIFAEVAPKTLAALNPERIAFPAAFILGPLLRILYPLVWLVNLLTSGLFKLLGISRAGGEPHALNTEELRTVVNEAGALIPRRHQRMLTNILDLEKVTVEDIMIPRNEIVGVDMDEDLKTVMRELTDTQHTRVPIFRGDIDHIIGILHVRSLLPLLRQEEVQAEDILQQVREPYFVPEGTPLNTQLLNFQRQKRRIGLVVDEYGDIQGLVTLEDILEEIVGEFTTDPAAAHKDIHLQEDNTYLVDAGISVRELNRVLKWTLPTRGPKTLNGLVIEYLETIPEPGTSLLLHGYPIEVVQTSQNAVKTVKIDPRLQPKQAAGAA